MAESEKELKNLLMVKEEIEKAGLKLNIQKTKIMASGPIISWQIDGKTMETMTDLIFLNVEFSANFFTLISLSSRGSLVLLHFLS